MKNQILAIATFTMLIASNVFADASNLNMIHSAKAIKAILEKGYSIPTIIDVESVEQMSSPPKYCIIIVYDRRPNTICPDEYMMGPYLDKGYVACFDPSSDKVDYISEVESTCS